MKLKFAFFTILNILLGLLFIFSAYSKLYPIEPFELTFVELKVANWYTAPFIARFLISIEFFIGILLISNLNVKFSSKLAILILLFFCLYLIAVIIFQGNNGNCGCFGTRIVMTPLQALLKNSLMIGLLLTIYFFHDGLKWKLSRYFILFNALASLALPHILNYVELSYSEHYLVKKEDAYPLGLDTLFKYATLHKPPSELKNSKHIIVFMSLTCPHCRIAAKKIRLMKELNPHLPFYFVLNGEESDLKKFFEDTRATNIPYCMLLGKPFVYLAGLRLPAIYFIQNDSVVNQVNYMELQQSEIEKWYNDFNSTK